MGLADALLVQAEDLLVLDPRRPKQVNLRRAVSGTYYALFHRVTNDAVCTFVGSAPNGRAIRDAISRWFNHGRMATVANWFARPLAIPQRAGPLRALLVDDATNPPSIRVPPDLVAVAEAFVALQEARHTADYDLSEWYSRATARALVGRGRQAFAAVDRLRGDPMYGLFLLVLLTGDAVIVGR